MMKREIKKIGDIFGGKLRRKLGKAHKNKG